MQWRQRAWPWQVALAAQHHFVLSMHSVELAVDVQDCFLGTLACCSETERSCCRRFVGDCGWPQASLLVMASWPAALGNVVQQLHDSVILAEELDRSLLIPPVFGEDMVIDMQRLAEAFRIDIIVANRFNWFAVCGDDGDPLRLYEVSGGGRAGPFRDVQLGIVSGGPMPVWAELIEPQSISNSGIWTYQKRGSGEMSKAGRWWGTEFPKDVAVVHWEEMKKWLEMRAAPGSSSLCRDSEGFLSGDLPPQYASQQAFRQHQCIVPALQLPIPQAERCLALAQLFCSVHIGRHREGHLKFFKNIHFSEKVRQAATVLAPRMGTGRSNPVQLRSPFLAMHLRPWVLLSKGFNSSSLERAFLGELRRGVRRLQVRHGAPDVFIASENTQGELTQRLIRTARQGLGTTVLSSDDTRPLHSSYLHLHVALDVLLCSQAEVFIGTDTSSVTVMIMGLRAAHGITSSRAWPALPRPELEELTPNFFPSAPAFPTGRDIADFFGRLHAKLRDTRDWKHVSTCSAAHERNAGASFRLKDLPRFESNKVPYTWLLSPFPRRPKYQIWLLPEELEALWSRTLWTCPAIAMLVNVYWLTAQQNASLNPGHHLSSILREFEVDYLSELVVERARFIGKLWYLIWTGRLSMAQLASAAVRGPLQAMLQSLAEDRTLDNTTA